jgi:hypothetical protein
MAVLPEGLNRTSLSMFAIGPIAWGRLMRATNPDGRAASIHKVTYTRITHVDQTVDLRSGEALSYLLNPTATCDKIAFPGISRPINRVAVVKGMKITPFVLDGADLGELDVNGDQRGLHARGAGAAPTGHVPAPVRLWSSDHVTAASRHRVA